MKISQDLGSGWNGSLLAVGAHSGGGSAPLRARPRKSRNGPRANFSMGQRYAMPPHKRRELQTPPPREEKEKSACRKREKGNKTEKYDRKKIIKTDIFSKTVIFRTIRVPNHCESLGIW